MTPQAEDERWCARGTRAPPDHVIRRVGVAPGVKSRHSGAMSRDAGGRSHTYPGGIRAVLSQMDARRDGLSFAPGEALPPLDVDFVPMLSARVTDPAEDPAENRDLRSSHQCKRFALQQKFTGAPEICFLNGLLISHLHKRDFPAHTPALFLRLWAEHGDFLCRNLDARWLVPSVTTFGDHGETPAQRSVGLALSVLFGTMKLYETERLYSGLSPDRPYTLDGKVRRPCHSKWMPMRSLPAGSTSTCWGVSGRKAKGIPSSPRSRIICWIC